MVLFEEKYGTLEYDPTVPAIVATFTGFMSSAQFRSFLTKGLDYLIEKSAHHPRILWLADTKRHVIQSDEDTKWVSSDWNPRALEAGIRHVAFVLPENAFGALSVKKYSDNSQKIAPEQIEIAMFNDLDKAKNWFRQLQKELV